MFQIDIECLSLDVKMGWVIDFGELSQVVKAFDHQFINEVPPFDELNPTAENLAKYVADVIRKNYPGHPISTISVRVWETENNMAEYRWSW